MGSYQVGGAVSETSFIPDRKSISVLHGGNDSCRGKIRKGRDQEHYFYEYGEIATEIKEVDLDNECGGLGLLKIYYEYTAKDFDGVVVGMKMVEVSAWLYVDYNYDEYHEGYYVGKKTEEQRKCTLVYYGCNKSRLVPMEDLEIIKEGEE